MIYILRPPGGFSRVLMRSWRRFRARRDDGPGLGGEVDEGVGNG